MSGSGVRPEEPFTVEEIPGLGARVVGLTDEGLGNTSWLVDMGGDAALVIDPERAPEPYVQAADGLGLSIRYAVETHLHADFVTGSRELAALGADVFAAAAGQVRWPHRSVADAERFDLGRFGLRVLATPGHTPEHVAYVLTEGDRPLAVFSGGSLLVGAVARTDLIDPADTEGLTRALWRSIHSDLLALPDDVAVFPTHGAGSFCSAAGGSRRWTTIGEERRGNPLLAAPDEDTFVGWVLDGLGTYPPYFLRLRALNRSGPRVFGVRPQLPALAADEVTALRDKGALVIDARSVADYAAGHVTGSLSIALRPQFASWLGWLVPDPDTPLLFVTDDQTDRAELVRQCLNIGYEELAGELAGGVDAWAAGGGQVATTELADSGGLADRLVIDVRQAAEYAAGHVPGATHVELGSLADSLSRLPAGPVAVMCGHGERAATAASVLEASGHTDVAVFQGGPDDWSAATGTELER
jgi:glyoxylase-like metal-dependent hydrolase (beta-lactamase superfamily II)